jgi:hypothetical protein
LKCDLLDGISAIISARFAAKPISFNSMHIIQSRHAAMIYWDDGVCLYRKSGPVLRLVFCNGDSTLVDMSWQCITLIRAREWPTRYNDIIDTSSLCCTDCLSYGHG